MSTVKPSWDGDGFWAAVDTEDVETLERFFKEDNTLATSISLDSAVAQNLVKSTRCMLEHGVDPNNSVGVREGLGDCRSIEVFRLLLEFKMDFKPLGADLLREVLESREIVDFLLDQGVDINATEDNGFVIPTARLPPPFTPAPKDNREQPHHPDHFDHSVRVLNRAAKQGSIEMFDHLVARGADPRRSIALHHACLGKSASQAAAMVSHLVTHHHFDVNGTSEPDGVRKITWWNSGSSPCDAPPLSWALYREQLYGDGEDAVVEALLANGAEPCDDVVETAAAGYGTLSALDLLLKAGGQAAAGLLYAVEHDRLDAARLCLEHGADANAVEMTEDISEETRELLFKYK